MKTQDDFTGIETRATCEGCGKDIPESIVGDALCTRCRYSGSDKAHEDSITEFDIACETVAAPSPAEAKALPENSDESFPKLLAWLSTPLAQKFFGRTFRLKLNALAWVNNPAALGGKSLTELADELGTTKSALSKYTAEASRTFKIQNGAQMAHHKSKPYRQ